MNDPRRLDQHAGVAVKRMLAAARREQPAAEALQRTLVSLGVGTAAATTAVAAAKAAGIVPAASASSTTSAAVAAGSAWGAATVVKWTVIGLAGGMAVIGAAHQVTRLTSSAPAVMNHAPSAVPAAAEPAGRPGARHGVDPVGVTGAAPTTTGTPAPAVPSASSGPAAARSRASSRATRRVDLTAEAAVLDRAREALRAGRSAGALKVLDEYRGKFGAGRLGLEAQYLRMEASLQSGQDAAAQAIARRLLRSSPAGPHAARARAIMERSNR